MDVTSKFVKGDKVVSTKDIGGVLRDLVPAGTPGVVLEGGWMTQAKVRFQVTGSFIGSRRTVDIRVDDDEIL